MQESDNCCCFEVNLPLTYYPDPITIQAVPQNVPVWGQSQIYRPPTLRLGLARYRGTYNNLGFAESAPRKTGALLYDSYYSNVQQAGKTDGLRKAILFNPFLVLGHCPHQQNVDILVLVQVAPGHLSLDTEKPPPVQLISADNPWVDEDVYRLNRENMAQNGAIFVSEEEINNLVPKVHPGEEASSGGYPSESVVLFNGDTLVAECVASSDFGMFLGVPTWMVEFELTGAELGRDSKDYAHSFRSGRGKKHHAHLSVMLKATRTGAERALQAIGRIRWTGDSKTQKRVPGRDDSS